MDGWFKILCLKKYFEGENERDEGEKEKQSRGYGFKEGERKSYHCAQSSASAHVATYVQQASREVRCFRAVVCRHVFH